MTINLRKLILNLINRIYIINNYIRIKKNYKKKTIIIKTPIPYSNWKKDKISNNLIDIFKYFKISLTKDIEIVLYLLLNILYNIK